MNNSITELYEFISDWITELQMTLVDFTICHGFTYYYIMYDLSAH
jgi:hypothetical protein